jgi:WD40 repeat protein
MIMDGVMTADASPFAIQQHGHKDMVEAVDFNEYGSRMALGSADGKIKVYDKTRDGTWTLCDTWGAHSAEILEVSLPSMALIHASMVICQLTTPPGPLAPLHNPSESPSIDSNGRQIQTLG